MSNMDIIKQLKKHLPNVLLLYGTEVYFIQQIRKEIEKKLAIDHENISTYDLLEIPIQEIINDAETYPFFGEQKLIVANNPTFLKANPEKLPFDHDLDELSRYITNSVDFSKLVIIAPYEKLDERKKITKQLKKNTTVVECNPIKEFELDKWIQNMAKQFQVRIENEAIEILVSELSTDLNLLENELEKLALYVGENGAITKEIAVNLISHSTNISALMLVDTVLEGDLKKALTIYKDLEKMKEDPIGLIALLAYQFRNILRVKLLKEKGFSQYEMQKQLKVHPYVVKIALNREKKFSVERLKNLVQTLANTDRQIKQGKMEKQIAFELLLYKLIFP